MVDRTTVSDAPAPVQAPAPTPVDISVQPIPAKGAAGILPSQGGMRIEALPTGAPGGDQRPAWLPEKFKSPEDLAQAYGQLEQRLGSLSSMPTPVVTPGATPGVPPAAPAAPAQPGQSPSQADLVARMTQEYAASGQVSEGLRQEFTQRTGLPAEFIDQQVAYLRHQGASAQAMAEQRLGGKGAVAELTEWAKSNLSQEERAAFNRLAYSGDEAAAQLAIDGLAAKYEAAVGRAPRIIAGRRPQGDYGGITPFQSEHELRLAQRDPRYKADPAYRAEVQDRLGVSMRLGIL